MGNLPTVKRQASHAVPAAPLSSGTGGITVLRSLLPSSIGDSCADCGGGDAISTNEKKNYAITLTEKNVNKKFG